jgi:hypothetical protein
MGWWAGFDTFVEHDSFARECGDFAMFIKKFEGYYDWGPSTCG